MSAIGPGPAELMVLLAFLGGFGLPLGVPPEPENPAMAHVAPEKCVLYVSWAAMAPADPKSTNQTEQLLAEPEIKRFAQSLEKTLRDVARRQADQDRGNPKAAQAARLMPSLSKAILTRSAAIFVTRLAMKEDQPDIEGGLLLDAGDDAKAIVGALVQLLTSPDASPEELTLNKTRFYRFAAQDGGIGELTVGTTGTYVLLGIGKGSVEGMIDRLAAKKAPAWLTDIQKRHTLERRASLSMINTKALVEAFLPLAGPEAAGVAQSLGLHQLGQVETVTGLDKEGMVSRTLVKIEGEPQGLLTLLGGNGIKPEKVEFIPRDAIVASAFSLNLQQVYNVVAKVVADNAPGGAENVDSIAQMFEDQFGMRLKEDLLASLGDVWTISMSPVDGWLGVVATAEVQDRDKLVELLDRVKGMLSDSPQPDRPRIESSKFGNYDLHSLVILRDMPIRLTWCVTDSRLIVGIQPQAVKSLLDVKANEAGLFSQPQFGAAFKGEGSTIAVGYQDSAKVFEQTYGILTLVASFMAEGIGDRQRFAGPPATPPLFDMAGLPSSRSIHRHLRPSVSVTRRTKAGVEMEVRQTFPTPNVGASAPVAVALLLPAVQAARTAARRSQSQNNLKQIMLAMHIHHDLHKHLPPQASTDKDGKPLLSWRVMVLPYIEQQALFNEFHLDEPWDSEHNKTLIAKMPPIYKSPASVAGGEGKTVYLGVSGDKGALPASKKPSLGPGDGLGFASFTDGLSNTIAVVEAGDESAVVWTKPDDLVPDEKDPLKGLLGLYPGGLNVGICDGSVRFIRESIDPTMLMHLFQRNDGNAVDFD